MRINVGVDKDKWCLCMLGLRLRKTNSDKGRRKQVLGNMGEKGV